MNPRLGHFIHPSNPLRNPQKLAQVYQQNIGGVALSSATWFWPRDPFAKTEGEEGMVSEMYPPKIGEEGMVSEMYPKKLGEEGMVSEMYPKKIGEEGMVSEMCPEKFYLPFF